MKIDPSEKQQRISSLPRVRTADRGGAENDFAKVLGDTVDKTSDTQKAKTDVVPPPLAPSMVRGIEPVPEVSASTTAHGLLNALERYQNLLTDPQASLKSIAPAVDDMRTLSKKASPILDDMPEGHPIKSVTREALLEVSKEIERFRAGYYVDKSHV